MDADPHERLSAWPAMQLTAIDIRDVRILERVAMEPGSANLITGPNAAGKTSILEAMHLLGTGRSFVGGRPDGLIRDGHGPMRIVARVTGLGSAVHRLGLERNGDSVRMRMDGRNVESVAQMARALPVLAVHPGSHELLAGGPGERRRLLDWGLFHVEPDYYRQWQRFRRAVAQRNVLLRSGGSDAELDAWKPELLAAASVVDRYRREYVETLQIRIDVLRERLLRAPEAIRLTYRRGWAADQDLGAALDQRLESDRSRGRTSVGPHRAEVVVGIGGVDARNRVSRGQQKLLVYLLRLAQAGHLFERTGMAPVLLLDDVAAELDTDHRQRILHAAIEAGHQIFVTAVDLDSIPHDLQSKFRMFHVEQGRLEEVIQ